MVTILKLEIFSFELPCLDVTDHDKRIYTEKKGPKES